MKPSSEESTLERELISIRDQTIKARDSRSGYLAGILKRELRGSVRKHKDFLEANPEYLGECYNIYLCLTQRINPNELDDFHGPSDEEYSRNIRTFLNAQTGDSDQTSRTH